MPKNWTIYQEFFLVDSGSFAGYNANMRQLVYEKLKDCSCVLFNRFEETRIDRMELHKAVRAVNTRCYIFYEAPDGSKRHNRLWNGGNGWGTVKLYEKADDRLIPVDEVQATHIGCEYGEYDQEESQ